MTERHHYKYVVLDSSKENGNAVQAKFNVQIPHGITNASRVCVKSFSMPNVIHSVYGDLKTVRFVEFYRPTDGGNWVPGPQRSRPVSRSPTASSATVT